MSLRMPPLFPAPDADACPGPDEATWARWLAIVAQRRAGGRAATRQPSTGPGEQEQQAAEAVGGGTPLAALYAPLLTLAPATVHVCAHLGQSIDGRIATRDGLSRGLNHDENLDHLHRMRALCDAIVVGAGTVLADDPLLTTRRVAGEDPVRVVIDGRGRLEASHGLCRDGQAPTLIVTGRPDGPARIGKAEVIRLPAGADGRLSPATIVAALARRGLHAIFVEGGGITVSRFLEAGVLDHLQLTIAPVVIGNGVRGLTLASAPAIDAALRPPVRQFAMGPDRLWDFTLEATGRRPAQD